MVKMEVKGLGSRLRPTEEENVSIKVDLRCVGLQHRGLYTVVDD
jgi:hypothetical protein